MCPDSLFVPFSELSFVICSGTATQAFKLCLEQSRIRKDGQDVEPSSQRHSFEPLGNQSRNQGNGSGLRVQPSQRPSPETNLPVEGQDDAEFSDFVLSQGYATPRSVADGEGTTSENVAAAHSVLFR